MSLAPQTKTTSINFQNPRTLSCVVYAFLSFLSMVSAQSNNVPEQLANKNWHVNYLVINGTVYNKPQTSQSQTEGWTVTDESDEFYINFSDHDGAGVETHFCYDTGSEITFYENTSSFNLLGDFIGGTLSDCAFSENRDLQDSIYSVLDSIHNPFTYKISEDNPVNLYISNSQNDTLFLYDRESLSITSFHPIISSFPNPAQDQLFIKITNGEIQQVIMYDLYGRKVLESRERKIDVLGLTKGLYLVKISSTHGVVTKKMIKL